MPSLCGFTWPDELDTIVREEAAASGVPLSLAYTLIAAESGFNPASVNLVPPDESYGLLQLNRAGGQGAGIPPATLLDPRSNLRIGLPFVARAFAAAAAAGLAGYDFIYAVATQSGHPGIVPRGDSRIWRIATLWICFSGGAPGQVLPDGSRVSPGTAAADPLAASVGLAVLLFLTPPLLAVAVLQQLREELRREARGGFRDRPSLTP